MQTVGGILANAMTGLRAQQTALNTVSHNIANAATEGYTRQRAVLSASAPLPTPEGVHGTGVKVVDVTQVRDAYLDATFRSETGIASERQARTDVLGRLEQVLTEPTENGLDATLDRFLSSWSELASHPTATAPRMVVRQSGQQLVDKMRDLATGLDGIRQNAEGRLSAGVERVNQLAETVGVMNREIVAMESQGGTAGDLRDSRARALDELSSLIPIKVSDRMDGSVGVATSGFSIVDGVTTSSLQIGFSSGTAGLQVVGRPGLMPDVGGSLGGLLEVINTDIPTARQSLDDLAEALVTDLNALHNTGTNAAGTTGVDFFDDGGITAWTLSLSSDVLASPAAIAAGTPDGTGGYRAGANDVALGIAGLRDTALGSLGTTPGEHLRGLVSSIGMAVRSSMDAAEVHQTLADQANVRRQSLSSVSVDEELVQLIQFQTAYQASARVVSAVDEMLQSVLAI